MSLDLGNLRTKTAVVDVFKELGRDEYVGELIVTYRPFVNTLAEQKKLARLASTIQDSEDVDDAVDFGVDQALAVIVEWTLTEGGEPVPLSREALLKVPSDILEYIGAAINSHKSPNRRKGKS